MNGSNARHVSLEQSAQPTPGSLVTIFPKVEPSTAASLRAKVSRVFSAKDGEGKIAEDAKNEDGTARIALFDCLSDDVMKIGRTGRC